MALDPTINAIYALLKALKDDAWTEFLSHTGDPDGGQSYRNGYSDLSDAIDSLMADAIAGRLADLQPEFDHIAAATKALNGALDTIQHDMTEFARYIKIVTSATDFVTTLRSGNLVTIAQAAQTLKNSFSPGS